ncbi:MAG TPA: IPT/TIG domain-containing protein [Solirubrobacteraceae bacterium]|nr:IPT/TIG domain-containing protein [Solirubrobacteraceae bacterium]
MLVALISGVAAQAALAAPEITKVTPKEGPAAGGTEVTIKGGVFENVKSVYFGKTAAIKYTVSSYSQIIAEAPTHADGTVDITVETREGTSEETTADHYTFTGALPKAPENVTLPVITPEKPTENAVESATAGTWKNLPSTYKYQWQHCRESCEEIKGATNSTYSPPYKYVGQTLKVSVIAENVSGPSKPALSAATKTVASNGVVEHPTGFKGLMSIAPGPEEHLWFSSTTGSVSGLGQMTTAGTILHEYTLSEQDFPEAIAEGADHNMWFTEWNKSKIGRITPSGTITEYALPEGREPFDIVKGPDGNMWFTEQGQGTSWGKIGKITTAGVITEYALPEVANEPVPVDITAGPEESLWFTLAYRLTGGAAKIDKITTAGAITEYKLPKCVEYDEDPYGITEGPDGNLWYTQVTCDKIGKMTPAGVFTEYKAGPEEPREITAGSDGDLWYTAWGNDSSHVIKMTTAGVISTEYALQQNNGAAGITAGPDKKIWAVDGSEVVTIEP